jgi:hypothetical protein
MDPSELSPLSLPLLLEALEMFIAAMAPSKVGFLDWKRAGSGTAVERSVVRGGDGLVLKEFVLDTDARRPREGGDD